MGYTAKLGSALLPSLGVELGVVLGKYPIAWTSQTTGANDVNILSRYC